MNLDITNYGHYRLTSHGGKSFDLFNRKTDKVYSISKDDFEYIKFSKIGDIVSTFQSTAEERCEVIESEWGPDK